MDTGKTNFSSQNICKAQRKGIKFEISCFGYGKTKFSSENICKAQWRTHNLKFRVLGMVKLTFHLKIYVIPYFKIWKFIFYGMELQWRDKKTNEMKIEIILKDQWNEIYILIFFSIFSNFIFQSSQIQKFQKKSISKNQILEIYVRCRIFFLLIEKQQMLAKIILLSWMSLWKDCAFGKIYVLSM